MTETQLVVFDVDGTLIDSQHLIVAAMEEGFRAEGLAPPSRAEILGIVGLSLPRAVEALAPELPEATLERLAEGYRQAFVAARERGGAEAHAPLYPGAREALDRLRADPGVLLGVATGKARRGLDHVLESHDLRDLFVTTQTADEHPSKPHPSMLETALVETGARAERAVMVGDTEFDIAMGRAAGFATIGVAWGYHPRARLEAAGADRVIEDFAALDAALAALLGERA
ncbi:HAD-IA family hydrolase [Amaricoccus solimangrovi]|uniref:HAD-IA family hydrolase n=1 Tax=Amaricoccus solimangrovi TaxID=2589815 RepID=A0A501WX19_9RHOB|nr:HAD-IA family hydrolase [Amaricoccus solimangrovi]TPE50416.1 HAD-IA family hydrolase [Amaricoccus solimangrovi]